MKILSYKKTAKGLLIVTAITDPNVNVLESKKAAVMKTTSTPEFKSLEASIALYNKFVEKCRADKVRFADPENVPEHVMQELKVKLAAITEKQQHLVSMEAQEMAENPVYLLPVNAVFITDELDKEILASEVKIVEDTLITIELSEDGQVSAWEVRPDIMGKLYRLPDSHAWNMIEEPDEFFPENATFEDPDKPEIERIEAARITALDPAGLAKEKQGHVVDAKNVLLRETLAAEHEDTPETIEAAKNAAGEAYKASIAGLDLIYS